MAGPVLSPGHPVVYCSRTLHPQVSVSISPGFILGLCRGIISASSSLELWMPWTSVSHSSASLCPPQTSPAFLPQTLAGSRTTPRVISLLLPGPGSWPPSNWFPLGVWEEHSGAGKERTRTRETPGAGGAWLERSAGKAELGSPGGSELARAPKATERASSPGRREGREWGGEMGRGEGTVGKTGRRPGLEEEGGPVCPSLGAGL